MIGNSTWNFLFLVLVHPSLKLTKLHEVFTWPDETQWNILLCTLWSFLANFPEPVSSPKQSSCVCSLSYYPSTTSCSKCILQLLVSGSPPSKELKSSSTLFYSLFKQPDFIFQQCLPIAVTQLSSCWTPLQFLNILARHYQLLSYDLFSEQKRTIAWWTLQNDSEKYFFVRSVDWTVF